MQAHPQDAQREKRRTDGVGMLDLRCYLVTSGTGAATVDVARRAAAAGAGIVQVRAKDATARELFALVGAVADAVAAVRPETRVVVNDRLDVALAARSAGHRVHGVHLGQDDVPARYARTLLGPDAVIGLTTGTVELARAANAEGDVLTYIGAGPFRPTPTKNSGRDPIGVAGYPAIVAATSLPVVAIGDVRPDDVPALSTTGIAGVALVRAIMHAERPDEVVRQVLSGWGTT